MGPVVIVNMTPNMFVSGFAEDVEGCEWRGSPLGCHFMPITLNNSDLYRRAGEAPRRPGHSALCKLQAGLLKDAARDSSSRGSRCSVMTSALVGVSSCANACELVLQQVRPGQQSNTVQMTWPL